MRNGDRLEVIPVSLSGGVEPGARTGTSLGGQPVVVWRGVDGRVRAWADRCPHRGMRLSFGFVRRNQLACIDHGWAFESVPHGGDPGPDDHGAFAACVAVPAHPAMTPPAKARVPAFGLIEALGMIWVGTGPGDTALPRDVVAGAGAGDAVHPVRSITVRAPVTALRAAGDDNPAGYRDRLGVPVRAALPAWARTCRTTRSSWA